MSSHEGGVNSEFRRVQQRAVINVLLGDRREEEGNEQARGRGREPPRKFSSPFTLSLSGSTPGRGERSRTGRKARGEEAQVKEIIR